MKQMIIAALFAAGITGTYAFTSANTINSTDPAIGSNHFVRDTVPTKPDTLPMPEDTVGKNKPDTSMWPSRDTTLLK